MTENMTDNMTDNIDTTVADEAVMRRIETDKKALRNEIYAILLGAGAVEGQGLRREGACVENLAQFMEERYRLVTDHLRLVATSKLISAKVARERGEDKNTLALMNESSASGLAVAIATLEGRTPIEVEIELENGLGDWHGFSGYPAEPAE